MEYNRRDFLMKLLLKGKKSRVKINSKEIKKNNFSITKLTEIEIMKLKPKIYISSKIEIDNGIITTIEQENKLFKTFEIDNFGKFIIHFFTGENTLEEISFYLQKDYSENPIDAKNKVKKIFFSLYEEKICYI